MISLEEIQKYLPQYLSALSLDQLFEDLKNFPTNLDKRLYSQSLRETDMIYQGDGMAGMPVAEIHDQKFGEMSAMVLSNSCDINTENRRYFPSRIVYAPILNLEKYRRMLVSEFVDTGIVGMDVIGAHISTIRRQEITQIVYLPKGGRLSEDSIVFLDRLNNYPADLLDTSQIRARKLFTLSNYGLYMFLIKLSIHFTRIQEKVDRIPN
jgi:hypothetical protein